MQIAHSLPKSFSFYWEEWKSLTRFSLGLLVLMSVTGGYLVGIPLGQSFNLGHFLLTCLGVFGLSLGASALNQIQEREVDAKMERTKKRPLSSGNLSLTHAYGVTAVCLTFGIVALFLISAQALLLGGLALFLYNGLYTIWWKKSWAYAAIPGAIPGALPIWIGFTAASGELLSPQAIYLFFIQFYWQMPHFWSLSIRFKDDYASGGIPTLPVVHGLEQTLYQIGLWGLSYVGLTMLAPFFFPVREIYLVSMAIMNIGVLWQTYRFSIRSALTPSKVKSPEGWLKFFLTVNFSLMVFLAALALDLWSTRLFPHFYID